MTMQSMGAHIAAMCFALLDGNGRGAGDGHDAGAHGPATRSTRWRRRPASGKSWPPDDERGSPSRARANFPWPVAD